MLETLLESKSTRGRSASGAIVSVTAHTALIAGALYATAQAHLQPIKTTETVQAVYFPPAAPRVPALPTTAQRPPASRPLVFVEPRVSINIPPIDMTSLVSRPGDFGPAATVGTDTNGSQEGAASPANAPFRSDQVEKQVAVVPGSAPPRYPDVLRNSGVEGQVTAVFVVDEHGRAEEASFRFPRSDNPLFEDAVRAALRRMRFVPAEVDGRKVRQLVQMPFVFTLAR
jgi:protein TonB